MSSPKTKFETDEFKARDELEGAHVEEAFKSTEVKAEAEAKGQSSSGYENLTLWQTVKLFKVATAYCFAAAFSAATDGYQIG